jgi:hypothetical protein
MPPRREQHGMSPSSDPRTKVSPVGNRGRRELHLGDALKKKTAQDLDITGFGQAKKEFSPGSCSINLGPNCVHWPDHPQRSFRHEPSGSSRSHPKILQPWPTPIWDPPHDIAAMVPTVATKTMIIEWGQLFPMENTLDSNMHMEKE